MNRREIVKLMGIGAATSLAARPSISSFAQAAESTAPEAGKIAGPFELRQSLYVLSSHHQAHDLPLRVLLPKKLDKVKSPGVLYVLPIEPEIQFRFGDGLTTVEQHDLHNKFGLIAVAPSFSDWPWYANHPTDPKIQFDKYCIPQLLRKQANLFSGKPPRLALFGYSLFGGPNPRNGPHIEEAHALMDSLHIPHIYDDSSSREHRWDSGWLEPAVKALVTMSRLQF